MLGPIRIDPIVLNVFYVINTHSIVLAWRIPGTEEPDGLPSMGLHSWT